MRYEIKDFLTDLERYYEGKYSEHKAAYIVKYLLSEEAEGYGPAYRRNLFSVLIRNFSGQYKSLPDIAIFEKYKEETLTRKERIEADRATKVYQLPEREVDPEEVDALMDDLYQKMHLKRGNGVDQV